MSSILFRLIIPRRTFFSSGVVISLSQFSVKKPSRSYSCKMTTKSALVILAPGAEELEFVAVVDVLRRAEVQVTVAGLNGTEDVKCSRGVVIKPDKSLADVAQEKFDVIVLPGGLGGAQAMSDSALVGEVLKKHSTGRGFIAAICAAPTVLAAHNIWPGRTLTSHPSVKDKLIPKYQYNEEDKVRVVLHDRLITSRGPGTATDFALKIVQELWDSDKVHELTQAMLFPFFGETIITIIR